jgi:tetratricopeptide (TPR) repeat protein
MIEAFIVLLIGSVLIVILNNLPEKGHAPKKAENSVKKMFESFHEHEHEDGDKESDVDNTETSAENEKEELIRKADKLLSQNKLKEAEKIYIEVLKIDEKDVSSYKGLGQICFKEKDYKDAHEVFEKLTKLVPKDASNYCNLGMCCYKEDNFSSALKNYEKALSLEKKPNYFKNMGIVQIKLKKYDEASESLIEFLDNDKKDKEVFDLLLSIIGEITDKKKAKKVVSRLQKIDPENPILKRESSRL